MSAPTPVFRAGILFAAVLFFSGPARAQFSKLDDIASQITKEVKPFKPHLIAVADFRSLDGKSAPQGHYFAWLLSNALQQHAKKKFSVAEHKSFDEDLAKRHISAAALVPGDAFHSVAPQVGANILVTGTVEKRDNSYLLQITPIDVSDAKTLVQIAQTILVSEFLDSFVTPFPAGISRAMAGVTMPGCIYCPNPSFSELARANKIQGSCVLEVLISASGEIQQIRPLRLLGYGLDEQAFNVIRSWKFRPATKDGTPVAFIVPVEVTFRLF